MVREDGIRWIGKRAEELFDSILISSAAHSPAHLHIRPFLQRNKIIVSWLSLHQTVVSCVVKCTYLKVSCICLELLPNHIPKLTN